MAEMTPIEMQDRELFAAMAMQALITRGDGRAADMIATQAVAYADARPARSSCWWRRPSSSTVSRG